MIPHLSTNSGIDFVLVTALPEERDAVLAKLSGYRQLPPTMDDIRTYYQAELPVAFSDNSTGTYRVIVMCLLGMGRVQAATATADAIRRWHPRNILLVGIAGGIAARDVAIGDLVISDQIVDYELQKITPEGPQIRWEVQRADPRLLSACISYPSDEWQEATQSRRPTKGKPKLHIGPIASGDKVIAFGDVLAKYREVWPKLLGVEMEAAGAATAAFQAADKPGFFMVRGVSDLADEQKNSANVARWRSYACDIAAAFAVNLLKSGPIPLMQESSGQARLLDPDKPSLTLEALIKRGLLDELANVFTIRDPNTIIVLDAVRFPRSQIPNDAANSLDFWQRICLQIETGSEPGSFEPVLAAAARRLPGNRKFAPFA